VCYALLIVTIIPSAVNSRTASAQGDPAHNGGIQRRRKVWLVLDRQGIPVARCTVERLMRQLGLRGAAQGKTRCTLPDDGAARPRTWCNAAST
jgi:transposase InsO family protein